MVSCQFCFTLSSFLHCVLSCYLNNPLFFYLSYFSTPTFLLPHVSSFYFIYSPLLYSFFLFSPSLLLFFLFFLSPFLSFALLHLILRPSPFLHSSLLFLYSSLFPPSPSSFLLFLSFLTSCPLDSVVELDYVTAYISCLSSDRIDGLYTTVGKSSVFGMRFLNKKWNENGDRNIQDIIQKTQMIIIIIITNYYCDIYYYYDDTNGNDHYDRNYDYNGDQSLRHNHLCMSFTHISLLPLLTARCFLL